MYAVIPSTGRPNSPLAKSTVQTACGTRTPTACDPSRSGLSNHNPPAVSTAATSQRSRKLAGP